MRCLWFTTKTSTTKVEIPLFAFAIAHLFRLTCITYSDKKRKFSTTFKSHIRTRWHTDHCKELHDWILASETSHHDIFMVDGQRLWMKNLPPATTVEDLQALLLVSSTPTTIRYPWRFLSQLIQPEKATKLIKFETYFTYWNHKLHSTSLVSSAQAIHQQVPAILPDQPWSIRNLITFGHSSTAMDEIIAPSHGHLLR